MHDREYDHGGVLSIGATQVTNRTGKTEVVLTWRTITGETTDDA